MPRAKPGPKPENGVGMERIVARYPWVGRDVNVMLRAWKDIYGVPYGRSITAAMRFASKHPDFLLPLPRKRRKV